jgi:cysteine desulfurase
VTADRDLADSRPVYLDYAATTPVDPVVATAMFDCLTEGGDFGNASSATHVFGQRAAARIERARAQVAAVIHAQPDEITFTSGGTESNNLAILGLARANADRGRHIITARTEHKAVLDPCKRLEREGFTVTYLTPDRQGRIDPETVRAALRPDTLLVSIMYVNNEIGVIQDVGAIAALCRDRGVAFHTDAAQAVGKIPVDVRTLPIDFLSFNAHKIYGPKGVGALYARRASRSLLQPVSFGGGQERGLRPGTLPTHQIVGFGAACEVAAASLDAEVLRLTAFRERLWVGLVGLGGAHLNSAEAPRSPGILNVSFEGVEGESLVTGLPELAISTGSACNSASAEPSYVLRALGRDTQLAQSSLRISVGRFTTAAEVDIALNAVRREVTRLRALSPASEGAAGQKDPRGRQNGTGIRTADSRGTGAADSRGTGTADSRGTGTADLRGTGTADLRGTGTADLRGTGTADLRGTGTADSRGTAAADSTAPSAQDSGLSIQACTAVQVIGEAGAPGDETWVRFHLTVEDGIVKAARFKVYGCPHTLSVMDLLARRLPGRTRTEGPPGTPASWTEELSVPVEKLGRLLVVEDALLACFARWPSGA